MKRDKQWEKPQADVLKRKKGQKVIGTSRNGDKRFGLGPLSPPAPLYNPDCV